MEIELAIADFERQNRNIVIQLNKLKGSSLRCAKGRQANTENKADRAESNSDTSEKVFSHSFEAKEKEMNINWMNRPPKRKHLL